MHASPPAFAGIAVRLLLRSLVCVAALSLGSAFAGAQALQPAAGMTSGGGHVFGTSTWLTFATGQPAAGRASNGTVVEVAGWLRLPAPSQVAVAPDPQERARLDCVLRPNPATGELAMVVRLPASAAASRAPELAVYDLSGRRLRQWNVEPAAGDQVVRWDGRDARGASMPPGVYLVLLRAAEQTITRRAVFVR